MGTGFQILYREVEIRPVADGESSAGRWEGKAQQSDGLAFPGRWDELERQSNTG